MTTTPVRLSARPRAVERFRADLDPRIINLLIQGIAGRAKLIRRWRPARRTGDGAPLGTALHG